VAGVEPQSETVWHQAEKFKVPLICFVNKMDRMGANFYFDLDSIHERLSKDAVPIQLPIGAEENFSGIINLFERKATIYKDEMGKEFEETEVPEEMKEKMEEYRHQMVEAICEQDDKLLHQYLEGKEPDVSEMKKVLRQAVIAHKLFPVLCGSALKNKGVQFMLDAVNDYLPSPLEVPPIEGFEPRTENKVTRKTSDEESFSALAFKVATDPFVGTLSFFRVYSGTLAAGSYVLNTRTDKKERVGRIVRLHANHREEVKEVYAGDIAAAVGLKNTTTGDTLCDENNPITLFSPNRSFPWPLSRKPKPTRKKWALPWPS
jgi:elongation factor G